MAHPAIRFSAVAVQEYKIEFEIEEADKNQKKLIAQIFEKTIDGNFKPSIRAEHIYFFDIDRKKDLSDPRTIHTIEEVILQLQRYQGQFKIVGRDVYLT